MLSQQSKVIVLILAVCAVLCRAVSVVSYGFEDGTLQGWQNNSGTAELYVPVNTSVSDNGGRTAAKSGSYMVLEGNYDDRDSDTYVKILTSPEFTVNDSTAIEIWTLGGIGAVTDPEWLYYRELPVSASDSGFMGAALRRVSDGEYLLFANRSESGQSNKTVAWLAIGWGADEIAAATAGDGAGESYVVDIIDAYTGSWGWLGVDDIIFSGISGDAVCHITLQPKTVVCGDGQEATFTVEAESATEISYSWHRDGSNDVISELSSLTLTAVGENEGRYYCVVSDDDGNSIESKHVVLSIEKQIVGMGFEGSVGNSISNGIAGVYDGSVEYGSGIAGKKSLYFDDEESLELSDSGYEMNGMDASFTVSLWLRGGDAGGQYAIMSYQNATGTVLWQMRSSGAGVEFCYGDDSFGGESGSVFDGYWHNVTLVNTRGEVGLYVDGVLAGRGNIELEFNDGGKVIVGGQYSGYVDELRVYNYAFNKSDIAKYYAEVTYEQVCTEFLQADYNKDCRIDLLDFCALANEWFANYLVEPQSDNFTAIYDELYDSDSDKVMVAAHRADWRHFPENSLPAVVSCFEMGVDIAEIDVRKTSDGYLVLMHDDTIDRTTNGSGSVSGMTYQQLMQYNLKYADGSLSEYKIPLLEDVMLAVRGNGMVNLDKVSGIMPEAYEVLKRTGTVKNAIFKSSDSADSVLAKLDSIGDDAIYMHCISCNATSPTVEEILATLSKIKPVAVEIVLSTDQHPVLDPAVISQIRQMGVRVWVNTLWDSISGGHSDPAEGEEPESWDWFIDRGVNMLQTDQPGWMVEYLESVNS